MAWKIELAAWAMATSGMGTFFRSLRTGPAVLALAYHRIGDGARSLFDRGLWSASPDAFDAQIRLLKSHADIIGPGDLPNVLGKDRGRYVLITFDDGYRDNYEWAFPILRHHGVGATFFISTGYLDHPRASWWDEIAWMVRSGRGEGLPASKWLPQPLAFDEPDRQQAVEQLLTIYKSLSGCATAAYMDDLAEATGSGRCDAAEAQRMWLTWDMVREMAHGGMWFGGHTVNHPILSSLPRCQQAREIAGCAERLREELGEPMRWFSYPRGKRDSFNADTRQCLRDQRVELAFSYYGGFRRWEDWDPYDIRRVGMEPDVSLDRLRAAMTLPRVFA